MSTVIRVFLGSPGDVPKERRHAEKAIRELSKRLFDLLDVTLQPVQWESFAPTATANPTIPIQEPINDRVSKAHIFIGILATRWGTETVPGSKESGTEAEFKEALLNRDQIQIMTYFREPSNDEDGGDAKQKPELARLKAELKKANVFHQTYKSPSEFRKRIAYDLVQVVLGILRGTRRRAALRRFFLRGTKSDREQPAFLIGYPGLDKHEPASKGAALDWTERLVPNIVYEDAKAIAKIEIALRRSGVSDVKAVTLDYSALRDPGNRVWLCLPRNDLAKSQLSALGKSARFRFGVTGSGSRYLSWYPPGGGAPFRIHSPLAKYLKLQRTAGEREWDPSFGRIFARDYAVIARYPVPDSGDYTRDGRPFWHYYVAGIRGLGTWGAGWYIQHRYDALAESGDDSPSGGTAVLLEVTFKDYRIHSAVDVSARGEDYFKSQNKMDAINRNIREWV